MARSNIRIKGQTKSGKQPELSKTIENHGRTAKQVIELMVHTSMESNIRNLYLPHFIDEVLERM